MAAAAEQTFRFGRMFAKTKCSLATIQFGFKSVVNLAGKI